MFSAGGASRSTRPGRIARADGDLVHVDVGRVEEAALLGDGDHGERVRAGSWRRWSCLRADRARCRPSGPSPVPTSSPMIEHRRLVALALADHHRAVDRQPVELAPHGVDRGLVGGLLVAAAAQPRRRDRRALGDAHEFQRQDAVERRAPCGKRISWFIGASAGAAQPSCSIRIICGSLGDMAVAPGWRRARRGSPSSVVS